MAKIICMASAKGGAGKTILTATFATFLSSLNKKILMVDVDASTNGLSLLYLKEVMLQNEHALSLQRIAKGSYELLNYKEKPELVSLNKNIQLIPANYSFINSETVDIEFFVKNLKIILGVYQNDYDYIFLDAQAGSDQFAHAAMSRSISNEVIIVSEYDPLSAAGVERLKALFREDLTYNRTWVLLNKMLPDFVKSFSDFLEVAKYLSPIPWDAEVVKSYSRRKLALDLENGNDFTLAIFQTMKTLFGDEVSKSLNAWLEDKAKTLKQPVENQYQETLTNIEQLFEEKTSSLIRRRRYVIVSVTSLIVLALYFYHEFPSSSFVPVVLGLGASFTFIIGELFFSFKQKGSFSNYQIDLQIKNLEEKLKKLDGLKSASPEELLRQRRVTDIMNT